MPLIYAKNFEAQSPQLDCDITTQPPSPPLAEEGSAEKRSRPSITSYFSNNPSDAVLNLRSLEQPLFFWGGLRYVLDFSVFSRSLVYCLAVSNELSKRKQTTLDPF